MPSLAKFNKKDIIGMLFNIISYWRGTWLFIKKKNNERVFIYVEKSFEIDPLALDRMIFRRVQEIFTISSHTALFQRMEFVLVV